jgi:hypothetical protein
MKKGMIVASAVAAMFSAGAASGPAAHAAEGDKTIKCDGGNSCRGKSECATADSGCQGQNNCKGKGWIVTKTAKECEQKGGKVAKD